MTALTVVLIIFLIMELSTIWNHYKNDEGTPLPEVLTSSIIVYTLVTGNTLLVPFLPVIAIISLVVGLFNEVVACRKLVNIIIKRYYL